MTVNELYLCSFDMNTGENAGHGTAENPVVLGSALLKPEDLGGSTMTLEAFGQVKNMSGSAKAVYSLVKASSNEVVARLETALGIPTLMAVQGLAKPTEQETYEIRAHLEDSTSEEDMAVLQMCRLMMS